MFRLAKKDFIMNQKLEDDIRKKIILKFLVHANETECSEEFVHEIFNILTFEMTCMLPELVGRIDIGDIKKRRILDGTGGYYLTSSRRLKKCIIETYPDKLI